MRKLWSIGWQQINLDEINIFLEKHNYQTNSRKIENLTDISK